MDPAVIIDQGSGYFKGGLAGNWTPSVVMDSVVGKPKTVGVHPGMAANDRYVGDEALTKRLVLDLEWPIQKGIITNFDHYEKLLKHTYSSLKVHSEEQPILLGEGMSVPQDQRSKLAELCFEKFGVRGFCQVSETVLATYGTGLSSALVIDFGENKTDIVPVGDAYQASAILFGGDNRLNIGGTQLTDYLCSTLRQSGFNFTTQVERELVRDMKEKLCYVAEDFEEEQKAQKPKASYTLPDGQVIQFGFQRYQVPEAFFRPEMLGIENTQSLQQLIAKSLHQHEAMALSRRWFAQSVVLCGGTSLLPGLADRLRNELADIAPKEEKIIAGKRIMVPKWEVQISAPAYRKYSTWYGGSCLAPYATFVTQERYDEEGAACVALAVL